MRLCEKLATDGFAIVDHVVSADEIASLIDSLDGGDIDRSKRGNAVFGARNLLNLAAVRDVASGPVKSLVEAVLGSPARAVRALFFDKTPEANWPVPWHQDLGIAVAERVDLPGWKNWTCRGDVFQVQPPAETLSKMLTVRIHLDGSGSDNGPLRVIPGSHGYGRLTRSQISAFRESRVEVQCAAAAGSALLMRPLLLHASSPSKRPSHRRVIQLEYSRNAEPAPGLSWAWA